MREGEVCERAFTISLTSPAYPPGPYRFVIREYLIISYRTAREGLRALVPEALVPDDGMVKFESIRMPDSTGFGDYTETRQVTQVTFRDRKGYSHCMLPSFPRTIRRRGELVASDRLKHTEGLEDACQRHRA